MFMKTSRFFLRCVVVFIAVFGVALTASSRSLEFEIDGIYYFQLAGNTVRASKFDAVGHVTIPSSVTYDGQTYRVTAIGSFASSYGNGDNLTLTGIDIPNSVTRIYDDAFKNCKMLTSIEIPNSVREIGEAAFCGSGLTDISISIPNSLTSIGREAFHGTPWYENQPDGVVYVGSFAYAYKGGVPEVTTISLRPGTTGIATGAFGDCDWMTHLDIPESVIYLGSGAFGDCPWYKNIYESSHDLVLYIGDIAERLRYDPENDSEVSIGTTLTFKSGTLSIADECVGYLGYNEHLPDSVDIVIPNSVVHIGKNSFSQNGTGYDKLGSITIGSSVKCIGSGAFAYFQYVPPFSDVLLYEKVTCLAKVPPVTESDFFISSISVCVSDGGGYWDFHEEPLPDDYVYKNVTLYVPKGSVEAYRNSPEWGQFTNIVGIDVPDDTASVCDVNGDGEVNIADVDAIIKVILSINDTVNDAADVNHDSEVNIADVDAVIKTILTM